MRDKQIGVDSGDPFHDVRDAPFSCKSGRIPHEYSRIEMDRKTSEVRELTSPREVTELVS